MGRVFESRRVRHVKSTKSRQSTGLFPFRGALTEKVPIDSTLDKNLIRDKLSEIKSLMFVEPNAMRERLTKIFAE